MVFLIILYFFRNLLRQIININVSCKDITEFKDFLNGVGLTNDNVADDETFPNPFKYFRENIAVSKFSTLRDQIVEFSSKSNAERGEGSATQKEEEPNGEQEKEVFSSSFISSTTVQVTKIIAKYLVLMRYMGRIAPEVFNGLMQIYNFYV